MVSVVWIDKLVDNRSHLAYAVVQDSNGSYLPLEDTCKIHAAADLTEVNSMFLVLNIDE